MEYKHLEIETNKTSVQNVQNTQEDAKYFKRRIFFGTFQLFVFVSILNIIPRITNVGVGDKNILNTEYMTYMMCINVLCFTMTVCALFYWKY